MKRETKKEKEMRTLLIRALEETIKEEKPEKELHCRYQSPIRDVIAGRNAVDPGSYLPLSHTGEEGEDSPYHVLADPHDIEHTLMFRDELSHLSERAKKLVNAIFEMGARMECLHAGTITKASIRRFLSLHWKWKHYEINGIFDEITTALTGM